MKTSAFPHKRDGYLSASYAQQTTLDSNPSNCEWDAYSLYWTVR